MDAPYTAEPAAHPSPGPAAGPAAHALKVMVIDDSKTIRRTAQMLLRDHHCEVITASDGFEALAMIVEERPAIIFVDIMMPLLDGYQTCAMIRNNPLSRDTPVVMLSSRDSLFDRARGRVTGASRFLSKPFTADELVGAIQAYLPDFR